MDILGGMLCGLIMSTVFLGVLVYVLIKNKDAYDRLASALPAGFSATLVLLLIVFGIPPFGIMLGIIAGLIYHAVEAVAPDPGLGSSNFVITIAALCVTALSLITVLVSRRSLARLGLIVGLAFAGIFGWLLPFLGDWR
jgi:hypothetical protein